MWILLIQQCIAVWYFFFLFLFLFGFFCELLSWSSSFCCFFLLYLFYVNMSMASLLLSALLLDTYNCQSVYVCLRRLDGKISLISIVCVEWYRNSNFFFYSPYIYRFCTQSHKRKYTQIPLSRILHAVQTQNVQNSI